jgi:hypothetical protein
MIGIIQDVLLELLERHGGLELRRAVLERAGCDPDQQYRMDRNYPDAECLALIEAARELTGLSQEAIEAAYADAFLERARGLFPRFFAMSTSSRDFLRRQVAIHSVLGASLRSEEERRASADKFTVEDCEDGSVQVHYRSANRLCGLYCALAHAVARDYGEVIAVERSACARRGGDTCTFHLTWPGEQAPQREVTHA